MSASHDTASHDTASHDTASQNTASTDQAPTSADPAPEFGPGTTVRGPGKSMRATVRDMVLSMGLVVVVIFFFMALTWRPQPDPVRAVDSQPVAQAVADAVSFPVLHPTVPAGWRATSARYEETEQSNDEPVWFNGWVTAADQYVAVVQADTTAEDFVEEQTLSGVPLETAPAEIPSGWDAYITNNEGQRWLVRQDLGVTTVVTGSVSWGELAAFIDMLQPVPPSPSAISR